LKNKVKQSDYWETRQETFNEINAEFGPLVLDACATAQNAKCDSFISEEQDGLKTPWANGTFVNCPYSDPAPWVKKASEEAKLGNKVVMLINADHTTQYYKDYIYDYSTRSYRDGVIVVKRPKREKFKAPNGLLGKNGKPVKETTNTRPSIVVVFNGKS
jgi:phage N-6-adenine-methyltransferase